MRERGNHKGCPYQTTRCQMEWQPLWLLLMENRKTLEGFNPVRKDLSLEWYDGCEGRLRFLTTGLPKRQCRPAFGMTGWGGVGF